MNYSKLNALRVHDLRDLARSVGVKSPTSKKKSELIKEIILILKGKAKPYVNKTKQGRPVKSTGANFEDIYSLFLTEDVLTSGFEQSGYNVSYDHDEKFAFYVNAPKVQFNEGMKLKEDLEVNNEKLVKFYGALDVHRQNYGAVRVNGFGPSKLDVYVQPSAIVKNNLKSGDFVSGLAYLGENKKPRILKQLLEVNSQSINDSKKHKHKTTKDFDDLDYAELTAKIKNFKTFNNKNQAFLEGSRNFVYGTSLNYKNQVDFCNELVGAGYKVFALYLNAMPEHKTIVEKNFVLDAVLFSEPEQNVVMAVNLLIKSAKRALENGEKIVVVLNNFSSLINAYNVEDSSVYDKALKKETVHFIKNVLSCAKNTKNNGSLTIFAADDLMVEQEMLDFYRFDLFKLFNTLNNLDENNNLLPLEPDLLWQCSLALKTD